MHTTLTYDCMIFHALEQLKKALKGHTFMLGDSVQVALVWGLRQQPKEFFAGRVH
jgi:hypothetical protein